MKTTTLTLLVAAVAASAFGMVDIQNVTFSQGFNTRDVTVTYDLVSTDEPDTPVYVMFDVLTNGVSIGREHIKSIDGNVNCVSTEQAPVKPSTGHSFVWHARKDWPDHRVTDAQIKLSACTVADFQESCDYLYVDLSDGASATSYPVVYSRVGPDTSNYKWKTTQLWLRHIRVEPLTTFTVGIPAGNPCKDQSQEATQNVNLSKDYWIGLVEMTQCQRKLIDGTAYNLWAEAAVININYATIRGNDGWLTSKTAAAGSLLGKLAERTGLNFDLPTGCQWEYACRAGTTTDLNSGKDITTLDALCPNLNEVAWYQYNTGGSVFPSAGTKMPNAWGLYDMHGSVSELCLDRNRCNFGEWDYLFSGKTDPFIERHRVNASGTNWAAGYDSIREVRGGNWRCGQGGMFTAKPCHSGYSGTIFVVNAYGTYDWLGFRPAITKNNELDIYPGY